MFKIFKKFSNIVISGPQRSGTRIAAKIIAFETKKTYIDEKDLNYHDYRLLEWYLIQKNVVIQCPALCHMLHYITDESTLITVIHRPIEEIISSEYRCWDDNAKRYELFKYGCSEGIISRIKYNFWKRVQRPILSNRAKDLIYHNLEKHSLFIKDRKDFRWDQTK